MVRSRYSTIASTIEDKIQQQIQQAEQNENETPEGSDGKSSNSYCM